MVGMKRLMPKAEKIGRKAGGKMPKSQAKAVGQKMIAAHDIMHGRKPKGK